MDEQRIRDVIRAIIKDYTKDDVKPEAITDSTHLVDELQIDSSRMVDIMLALEEKLDIDLPDEETENAKTVGQILEIIQSKVD